MSRLSFLIFFLWLVPLLADPSQEAIPPHFQKLEDWKILTDSSIGKGPQFKASAEGLIRADPEKVWEVLIDLNNWKSIFPHLPVSSEVPPETVAQIKQLVQTCPIPAVVLEAWRVRLDKAKEENGPWWKRHLGKVWDSYLFEIYNFPWPVTNRWAVNHFTMDERARDQKRYRMDWELLIGTFRVNHGFYELEPYSRNRSLSHLSITFVNDPGLDVPQSLLLMGSHLSLPNLIRGVRRAAERRNHEIPLGK